MTLRRSHWHMYKSCCPYERASAISVNARKHRRDYFDGVPLRGSINSANDLISRLILRYPDTFFETSRIFIIFLFHFYFFCKCYRDTLLRIQKIKQRPKLKSFVMSDLRFHITFVNYLFL